MDPEALKERVIQAEGQLKLVADALEKRNQQLVQWSQLYNDPRNQFIRAQDTCNAQAQTIKDLNSVIANLQKENQRLDCEKMQEKLKSLQKEAASQKQLYQKEVEFKDQLTKLSTVRAPGLEKLSHFEEYLKEKNTKVEQLEQNLKEVSDQLDNFKKENNEQANQISQLQNDKGQLESENRQLALKLIDAKSGREEYKKIEDLQLEIDKLHQQYVKTLDKCKKLKKVGQVLNAKVQEKERICSELQDNIEILVSKVTEYSNRLQTQMNRNDELREKCSKAVQNERTHIVKYNEKETECKKLQSQVQMLEEHIKSIDRDHIKAVHNRIKGIQNEEIEKEKKRSIQIELKKEREKRLDVEENLFKYKDQIADLQKEISLLKEQLADAKGADVQPLIDLIQDLRVEAIGIDPEFNMILDEIPEETPFNNDLMTNNDICDTERSLLMRISANMTQMQIENRELRLLLDRALRIGSIYHRVSHTIAQYPLLSIDDIGTQTERGYWLLPADVEHLQRTIIKLHEILIRRKYE